MNTPGYRAPTNGAELIAYLEKSRGWVRYQAPLDCYARLVKVTSKVKTWKRDPNRFQCRIDPQTREADPFTADNGHLDRFRIPVTAAPEFIIPRTEVQS